MNELESAIFKKDITDNEITKKLEKDTSFVLKEAFSKKNIQIICNVTPNVIDQSKSTYFLTNSEKFLSKIFEVDQSISIEANLKSAIISSESFFNMKLDVGNIVFPEKEEALDEQAKMVLFVAARQGG